MRVSHLALDDFRSWKHGVVELREGPTVLVGANGQGKTNLVEALAYLSTFSSHRVGAEGALVRIPIDEAEAGFRWPRTWAGPPRDARAWAVA